MIVNGIDDGHLSADDSSIAVMPVLSRLSNVATFGSMTMNSVRSNWSAQLFHVDLVRVLRVMSANKRVRKETR